MTDDKSSELAKYEKRGWLMKRDDPDCCCCCWCWCIAGQLVQNWKKRYFVLKDGCLFYYDKPEDLRPKGQMNLFGAAAVFVQYPKVSKPNCLEISTPERTLYVYADTQADIKSWALQIQKAAIVASGGKLKAETKKDSTESKSDSSMSAKTPLLKSSDS